MKVKDMIEILSQQAQDKEVMMEDSQNPLIMHPVFQVETSDYVDIFGNVIPVIVVRKH